MKTVELYAPREYLNLSPEEKARLCNGAGPKGFGWIVPDTLWGLSITEAANIHDFMYAVGETLRDKEEADRVFLNNMLRIIAAAGGPWWLQALRRRRARIYFEAVSHFGGPAFWSGKNAAENLVLVPA